MNLMHTGVSRGLSIHSTILYVTKPWPLSRRYKYFMMGTSFMDLGPVQTMAKLREEKRLDQ